MDEVLEEIPRVREDLGFIPLVTPTSQIVGTQSVINVLTGERYKSISKETAGVLTSGWVFFCHFALLYFPRKDSVSYKLRLMLTNSAIS